MNKLRDTIHVLKNISLNEEDFTYVRNNLIYHTQQVKNKSLHELFFSSLIRIVSVTCIIVISFSGGVAALAQESLPGELLYHIKTEVTEPVRVLIASTPERKVQIRKSFIKMRLLEAKILEKAESLSAESSAVLSKNIEEHTKKALEELQKDNPKSVVEKAIVVGESIAHIEEIQDLSSVGSTTNNASEEKPQDNQKDELVTLIGVSSTTSKELEEDITKEASKIVKEVKDVVVEVSTKEHLIKDIRFVKDIVKKTKEIEVLTKENSSKEDLTKVVVEGQIVKTKKEIKDILSQ